MIKSHYIPARREALFSSAYALNRLPMFKDNDDKKISKFIYRAIQTLIHVTSTH